MTGPYWFRRPGTPAAARSPQRTNPAAFGPVVDPAQHADHVAKSGGPKRDIVVAVTSHHPAMIAGRAKRHRRPAPVEEGALGALWIRGGAGVGPVQPPVSPHPHRAKAEVLPVVVAVPGGSDKGGPLLPAEDKGGAGAVL